MNNFENPNHSFPTSKGNYLLVFQMAQPTCLEIGSLGRQAFPVGLFAYAGSALGPGGLQARIRHHLKPSVKPHWHIDYLKPYVIWQAIGWKITNQRLECEWSQHLLEAGATAPVPRFGASDCHNRCQAHLLHLNDPLQYILTMLEIRDDAVIMYNKSNF
ncbi:MAG: GIY-YIG nuclease family protein [Anaerolineae bacterium]|jgi:Uri superfamily endonuclease|nr:GIY-YIG nuclease family protein [Anaerolineae bacterium]